MRAGLTTSVIGHAALLAVGLFSLSAPKAFDVADVEALPVEIVSVTQIQQGDKKAERAAKPAPTPTKKPAIVPDAQKNRRQQHRYQQAGNAGADAARGSNLGHSQAVTQSDPETAGRAQASTGQAAGAEARRSAGDRPHAEAAAQAGTQARPGRRDDRRRQRRAGGGSAAGQCTLPGGPAAAPQARDGEGPGQ